MFHLSRSHSAYVDFCAQYYSSPLHSYVRSHRWTALYLESWPCGTWYIQSITTWIVHRCSLLGLACVPFALSSGYFRLVGVLVCPASRRVPNPITLSASLFSKTNATRKPIEILLNLHVRPPGPSAPLRPSHARMIAWSFTARALKGLFTNPTERQSGVTCYFHSPRHLLSSSSHWRSGTVRGWCHTENSLRANSSLVSW